MRFLRFCGQVLSEPRTLSSETPEQRELGRLRRENDYLRRQRDILKKSLQHLVGRGAAQRFTVMEQMKASHCFTEMADALEISQSGFHAHERKEERPRAQQDKELLVLLSHFLWPVAGPTAVHASCMRCAQGDGAAAKIASPGSCAHAVCAPGKNGGLDLKPLTATINCLWHQTG